MYDSHKESLAIHDMEVEMFGEALKDDDLADELDALVADTVKDEIADLGPLAPIKKPAKQAVEEDEEEVSVKPKRKLVAS